MSRKEVSWILLLFITLPIICTASKPKKVVRSLKAERICPEEYEACQEEEYFPNLVHVTAEGPDDSLHYVISTIGIPTVLVARTPPHAVLRLEEDALFNSSSLSKGDVSFEPAALDVYSIMLPTLYEYNDVNDTADLDLVPAGRDYWRVHGLAGQPWGRAEVAEDGGDITVTLAISANASDASSEPFFFHENGSLSLSLDFRSSPGRSDVLPHLQFLANNSQLALTLDGLAPSFPAARYGLQLVLLSQQARNMSLDTTRSIDDEHTPGVFKMVEWSTEGTAHAWTEAYLQWKPICYKLPARTLASATKQFYYDLVPGLGESGAAVNASLLYAYFGEELHAHVSSAANVSFGLTNDKFYVDTNYTTWTFAFGQGVPPKDLVSQMVQLVISIGLGLPVLFILIGGVGVCIRGRKRATVELTSSYSEIQ